MVICDKANKRDIGCPPDCQHSKLHEHSHVCNLKCRGVYIKCSQEKEIIFITEEEMTI